MLRVQSGAMTASIATAEKPHTISSSSLSSEIEEKCRKLLPPDLLDINDRFFAFICLQVIIMVLNMMRKLWKN